MWRDAVVKLAATGARDDAVTGNWCALAMYNPSVHAAFVIEMLVRGAQQALVTLCDLDDAATAAPGAAVSIRRKCAAALWNMTRTDDARTNCAAVSSAAPTTRLPMPEPRSTIAGPAGRWPQCWQRRVAMIYFIAAAAAT